MILNQNAGARWLQREGTFCVMCSRVKTECKIFSQEGGAC